MHFFKQKLISFISFRFKSFDKKKSSVKISFEFSYLNIPGQIWNAFQNFLFKYLLLICFLHVVWKSYFNIKDDAPSKKSEREISQSFTDIVSSTAVGRVFSTSGLIQSALRN